LNNLGGGCCVLLLVTNRLDYSIDLTLRDALGQPIVLLNENELDASLVVEEVYQNSVRPNSWVSFLKSFRIFVLYIEDSAISRTRGNNRLDQQQKAFACVHPRRQTPVIHTAWGELKDSFNDLVIGRSEGRFNSLRRHLHLFCEAVYEFLRTN
jgi:hypothetical protein